MAERSRGSLDHGRVTHVVVKLPEMYISDFEKINPRTSRRGGFEANDGMWRLKLDNLQRRRSQRRC